MLMDAVEQLKHRLRLQWRHCPVFEENIVPSSTPTRSPQSAHSLVMESLTRYVRMSNWCTT